MKPINTPDGHFVGGNGSNVKPTIVTAEWLNAVQDEILNVILAGQLEPSSVASQLLEALNKLYASKTSLGTAASKDIGNGANQIPDMSFFGVSMASQGYQKLPSGLIHQWGIQASAEKTTTRAIFPIPFPNACLLVLPIGANAGANVHASTTLNGSDKNGFTFNAFQGSSGSSPVIAPANGVACHYFAIGR